MIFLVRSQDQSADWHTEKRMSRNIMAALVSISFSSGEDAKDKLQNCGGRDSVHTYIVICMYLFFQKRGRLANDLQVGCQEQLV